MQTVCLSRYKGAFWGLLYPIDPRQPCRGYGPNCIWIITEADRSVTTSLLSLEY